MIKKVVAIIVLVLAVATIAGCANLATNTPSPSVSVAPSPSPTPAPVSLYINGPSTIALGQGGTWTLYIDGQLPTVQQAAQIVWSGTISGERNPPAPVGVPGSITLDSNTAANTSPGTYTLTATYEGVSTSITITRVPNPT
ncbi:MAG TPA: hypothetical protein VEF35_03660 [Candidatus Bathyarchaeia archaeon]|nr:hypothetical protein [Candidatus Bathyarchaeia archaeon]